MGRHQKLQLTAHEFRDAFVQTLSRRMDNVTPELPDRRLIELFEGLSAVQRTNFWEDVKSYLRCPSDWPVKHYSNVFLAAKYTQKLQSIPDAKRVISDIVDAHFRRGCADQKLIKQECYKQLSQYDIFPIQIDNQIYHMVKDARRRFIYSADDLAEPQAKVQVQRHEKSQRQQMQKPPRPAAQPRTANSMRFPELSDAITTAQHCQNIQQTFPALASLHNLISCTSCPCPGYDGNFGMPMGLPVSASPPGAREITIPPAIPALDFSKDSRLSEKSIVGIQILQSIVTSQSASRPLGFDEIPSLGQFLSTLAPGVEDNAGSNDEARFRNISSQIQQTEEQYDCFSQIQRKSQTLQQGTNESFEAGRFECTFERRSQEMGQ